MDAQNFVYWLQGWFELNETIDYRDETTKETKKMIKEHLDLVLKHKIQNYGTIWTNTPSSC